MGGVNKGNGKGYGSYDLGFRVLGIVVNHVDKGIWSVKREFGACRGS